MGSLSVQTADAFYTARPAIVALSPLKGCVACETELPETRVDGWYRRGPKPSLLSSEFAERNDEIKLAVTWVDGWCRMTEVKTTDAFIKVCTRDRQNQARTDMGRWPVQDGLCRASISPRNLLPSGSASEVKLSVTWMDGWCRMTMFKTTSAAIRKLCKGLTTSSFLEYGWSSDAGCRR